MEVFRDMGLSKRYAWRVVRLNDDGRREHVNGGMCWLAADKVAGALRDASSEAEIAAGWNYLPQRELRTRVTPLTTHRAISG
jgi:hypothetical protein